MANQDEYPSTFETLLTNNNITVLRLKVPGGWIVILRDSTNNFTNNEFVSDPHHYWDVV